ncbi:MAG: hypothetical protein COV29_02905 [Candidatus Yanofskybacteria bacterium CG10_big_fil_rev_8_21_14_0_10_36_16]|uniref:Transglycosylase SLT domain-containing protein n=1 Tax=Candidatus Yanofskybacteria bacterium CG10_big_fil_rev_8_21_14_0_10_36_16 TaxID=1975096 RepID=A0A2J0Q6T5_9BACT|nr:MAG: hypothetical protein COV29_02905 [Candidatus Yanofskybacteria bacterium CG10_big_fil_rev_8_21_14_0_10_36_16]
MLHKFKNLSFTKKIIIISVASAFGGYFLLFGPTGFWDNFSKEIDVLNSFGLKGVIKKPNFSYVDKIDLGIDILEHSAPLDYKTDGGGNLISKQIAFAVLNINTGDVFEKRAWIRESDIENYKELGRISLVMENEGPDISIQPNWYNGFNSDYYIINRPEMVVVANKYLLPSSALPPSKRLGGAFTDIVYVPYSGGLHTEEVIEEGRRYLNELVYNAYKELEFLGVRSRTSRWNLATELVPENLVKNIIVIEHTDPDLFNRADIDGKENLLERVLVIIGGNKGRAYGLTGSSAGASGMAQFIRPTYEQMVRLYPEAELIDDYRLGMMDHHNAIKAMVLFFDRHVENLKNSIDRKDIVDALGISEEMLAASYNGGPARVVRSVNEYGLAWINVQLNSRSETIFRPETIAYIKKYQYVRGLGLF